MSQPEKQFTFTIEVEGAVPANKQRSVVRTDIAVLLRRAAKKVATLSVGEVLNEAHGEIRWVLRVDWEALSKPE